MKFHYSQSLVYVDLLASYGVAIRLLENEIFSCKLLCSAQALFLTVSFVIASKKFHLYWYK